MPVRTAEWTDHDVSDPGVTLLELLAFLGDDPLHRPRWHYFGGRRLQPSDLASEQCARRPNRRLLWTVCGISAAALLLWVAARRRARAQQAEPDVGV